MFGQRVLGQVMETTGKNVFFDLLVPLIVETIPHPLVKAEKVFAWKLLNRCLDLLNRAHTAKIPPLKTDSSHLRQEAIPLNRRQGLVPVFPDRFEAEFAEAGGDFGRGTLVGDGELLGRGEVLAFGRDDGDGFAARGVMNRFGAGAGVAAGLGVGTGAHHGDAQTHQAVAQRGRFARGEDDADLREAKTQREDGLHQRAVVEFITRGELARRRTQARQRDGD